MLISPKKSPRDTSFGFATRTLSSTDNYFNECQTVLFIIHRSLRSTIKPHFQFKIFVLSLYYLSVVRETLVIINKTKQTLKKIKN